MAKSPKPTPLAADDWQSIALAPTDGRDLKLVAAGGRQFVGRWHPGRGAWVAADVLEVHPTHFQLLDEGPLAPVGEAPRLLALLPSAAALGTPSFTLRVLGQGFTAGSLIYWNGVAEPTTVVSDNEVTTEVDMTTAQVAMQIPVLVQNADGPASNTLVFSLTEAPAAVR